MRLIGCRNKLSCILKVNLYCIFIVIQGCSESTIGEKLSNSFDQPISQPQVKSKIINSETKKPAKKIDNVSQNKLNTKERKNLKKLKQNNKKSQYSKNIIPFTPTPYRITIKLSGTNPSAPSDMVTKALIKAGVKFEVEMIERVYADIDKPSSSKRGIRR